ncbi:MAG: Gfo/Idh/MocA family protein [Akkermansiaceae bacterium]
MSSKLSLAICGCGSRARTYSNIAMSLDDQFEIIAGADPITSRVDAIRKTSNNPDFKSYDSAEELLAQPKLADIMLITTQDQYHFGPAKKALELGYHILLEKPAAQSIDQVRELADIAKKLDRKIILCFVLRYTNFYSKVKEIVDSKRLGEIVSIRAHEGVDAFHQAHSFVRGHWAKSAESTPMIIAKCCHDTDIISWLMDSPCKSVSSIGGISHFSEKHAPEGATERCTDGCPHADTCLYSSLRYTSDRERWLNMVFPNPTEERTKEEILDWLSVSPWGRCVYKCDNDVVDHQQVMMDFENGTSATLSMTAFDCGRTLEIYGTKGSLRGGDSIKQQFDTEIVIRDHYNGELEKINLEDHVASEYAGHGGGDFGLISALSGIIHGTHNSDSSLIETAIEGHVIGFAAEKSRLQGGVKITL